MYLFKAFQDVLFSPKEFFASKLNDDRLAGTFFYGFILTVISGLIRYGYIIVSHASQQLESNKNVTNVASLLKVDIPHLLTLVVIVYSALMFIGLLFVSLFIHIGMRIMKGTGSLRKTYQAFIFGSTPYFIFGAFPIIGYVALVYGLYIKVIGLSAFHGIRFDYTIVGYIIGRIIEFFVSVIVVFFILAFITLILFIIFGPTFQLNNNLHEQYTATSTFKVQTKSI